MNRDEILEKSRKENSSYDEMERDVIVKAGQKATAVGGIMCAVIIILEVIFSDSLSGSIWAVYLSMTGTSLIVKYIGLKNKVELIFGSIQLLLAAIFFAMYVVDLAG